ncbi:MAG: hypothetical protein FWE11_03770 [Defluviitaleaceae bacterium]|nr:hypothetical protein [Defluviitaleaceae bacterium]
MNGIGNDRNRSRLGGVGRTRIKFIAAFFFVTVLVAAVVLANTSTYTYETGQLGPYEEIWSNDVMGLTRVSGIIPMSSGVVHRIETPDDLAAFLRSEPIQGTPTANNDEFIIDGTINMQGQGSFHGRGFVNGQPFTGLLIGENNATITNLTLIPRTAAETPDTPGHNDFGLIRVLGNGAVVENLTFSNVNYNDPAGLVTWNNVEGSIGLVAGRILPNSTVTMNNITIHGATSGTTNAAITFAGGARETNNKRVGGLVGATDSGSVLHITNVDVRLQVALNTTGTPGAVANRNVHTSGGLVGLAAGDVHISSTGQFINRVHFQPIITTAGGSRVFLHIGGVIGRLTSPTAGANASTIYRLHTSTEGAVVPVTQSLGGFIGDAQHVTITHSENHFSVTSATHRGGFIGISRGNIVINDSHNHGTVGNGGTIATGAGGFIGAMLSGNASFARSENHVHLNTVTGTANHGGFIGISRGSIEFYRSYNHGNIFDTATTTAAAGNNVGRGGFIGFMYSGSANFYRTRNYGDISTISFGRLGGFVGRALGTGTITIENSANHGDVRMRNTDTGTGAEIRTRVASAGGFVGYITTSVHVTDTTNYGDVRVHGRGGGGGIAGSTSSRGGTSTTLTRVHNRGNIYGQHTQNRYIGGMIGHSRNNITINDSTNHGIVRLTSSGADNSGTINRSNAVGGFIGMATGIVSISDSANRGNVINDGLNHRAGGRMRIAGFVGMCTNRLTIERSHNFADITSVRAGTGGTTSHHGAGGIVGRITFRGTRANRVATITDVSNRGIVNGTGRTGGIVGSTRHRVGVQGLTISNATNTGDIRSWVVGGGIIGQSNSVNTTIMDVTNTGHVTVHNVGTPATNRGGLISGGGIVGRSSRARLNITRAGNDASVTVISTNAGSTGSGQNSVNNTNTAGAGGIVGNIQRGTRNQITLSYNAGAIRGHMRGVGGIVGGIRRTGTTLIEDTYNVGLVHSTLSINTGGTSVTGTDGAAPGNGILGLRRNVVGMITLNRVYNAGNVSGHPIFRGSRGRGGARGTPVGQTRRMTYRDVFFDTSIHTGQATAGFVTPTMQPVPTSILTSGGLAAFSGDNWRIRGWLDHFDPDVDVRDTWETYPHLAWQIDFEDEPRAFFQLIEPGADHLMLGPTRDAYFWHVQGRGWAPPDGWPGTWVPPGGWSGPTAGRLNFFEHPHYLPWTRHDLMRTFNQYAGRAGTGVAHPYRDPGNSVLTGITPNQPAGVIRRMSIGLISPRGVVAFNGNELFDGLIIVGVDYYLRNQVVTWSRMYVDDAPPYGRLTNPPFTLYAGMLNLSAADAGPWEGEGCGPYCLTLNPNGNDCGAASVNANGHQVRLTALGYHDAWTCITIDQVSQLGDGRVLIRVPMRRAPIDNLVLALHNDSAPITESQDLQPGILAARDPRARSTRDAVNSHYRPSDSTWVAPLGNHVLPTWGRVQAAPRHQDLPIQSHFDISGSYWHDLLTGMGNGFSTESLTLIHSAIENPHNENPSPENPFIVRIGLRDIDLPDLPLRVVREFEHDDEDLEEGEIYLAIPHGGRAGNNTPYYWFTSGTDQRFTIELRNPDGIRHSNNQPPRIIAGIATLETAAVSTAAPATLSDINSIGNAASQQRSSGHWWISNVTEYTEVRIIPLPNLPILSPATGSTNADGETSGNGGNITRSFRPSEWMPLSELIEWSNDDDESEADYQDPIRINVPIEYEHTRRVAVIERHIIIEGQVHQHRIPITNATLRVLADVGLDTLEDRWQVQNPANSGIFNPVRFIDGEEAEATAPNWSAEREVLNTLHPGDVDETIYIMLTKDPLARIYGFTLCDSMLITPQNLVVRPDTIVNVIDRASGMVIASTTSDIHGFFEVFLPPGTFPGSYLVIGTHPQHGFGTSVPSPVDIPVGADNARVNIFLGNAGYFPIFVRTLDMLGNNVSSACTASLTYGMSTSPRFSTYDSPYKLIMVRTADRTGANGWINGNISVNTDVGVPVGIVNIAQYLLDYPLRNPEPGNLASQRYQFLIITFRQGLPDWRRLNNAINATTDPPDRIVIHPKGTTGVPDIEMVGGVRIFNLIITDEGDGNTITTVPITTPTSDLSNPHRIRVARQVSVEAAPDANITLRMPVAGFPNTPDEPPWNASVTQNLGRHFVVNTDAGNFTLGGAGSGTLILDGNAVIGGVAHDGNRGGVQVDSGAEFTMLTGSMISNGRAVSGGGVNVSGQDTTFTMIGGVIGHATNPQLGNIALNGGGVWLGGGATFNMQDYTPAGGTPITGTGRIDSNDAANNGGGVFVGDGSTFTLARGAIHNNVTTDTTQIAIGGGGVFVTGAYFYMTGGEIYSNSNGISRIQSTPDNLPFNTNRGGGVHVASGGFFEMDGGIIRNNNTRGMGAGINVSNNGTFIMMDGRIRHNWARSGGGVYMEGSAGSIGTFEMHGGFIYNNRAIGRHDAEGTWLNGIGGGVRLLQYANMVMYGGVIHDNDARQGGGIANGTATTLTIHPSSRIRNNHAIGSDGGGIRLTTGATGNMLGGNIYGNTAIETGGGIMLHTGSTFNMSGGVIGGAHPGPDLALPNPNTNSAFDGGGIFVDTGATIAVTTGNAAGTGVIGNRANNSGGGLWLNTGVSVTFTGQLNNNVANVEGGGAYVSGGANLTVNGQVHQNAATRGGGVFVDGPRRPAGASLGVGYLNTAPNEAYADITPHDDHINEAPLYAGIVPFSTAATLTVNNGSTIYRNTAGSTTVEGNGGGVWVAYGSTFNIHAVTFTHNRAYGMGGAIFSERHDYNSPITRPLAYTNLVWPGGSAINFGNNWAPDLQTPPINATVIIPAANFGTTSPAAYNHVLNNWDVNFRATDLPFTFTKIDNASNTPLSGVVFYLYRFTDGNYVRVRGTSAPAPALVSAPTTGQVTMYLTQSRYRLVEVSVPHPFWVVPPAGTHWYITVTGENAVISRSNANAPTFRQSGTQLTAINPASNPVQAGVALTLHNYRITQPFAFHKTDHLIYSTPYEINLLPGAEFRLFRTPVPLNAEGIPDLSGLPDLVTTSNVGSTWEDVTPTAGLISTDNMHDYMSFDFVSGFVYQLMELHAPEGFQRTEMQWRIQVVNNDFVVTTMGTAFVHTIDMRRLASCTCNNTPCDRPVDFFIGNFPSIELPMAGGNGSTAFVVSGGLLVVLATVLMGAVNIVKKNRKLHVNYARTL